MRPSRGWYRLLYCWLAIVSLSGLGIGTLEILGPPFPAERPMQRNDKASTQIASLVPIATTTIAPASAPAVAVPDELTEASASPDPPQPSAPAVMAAREPAVPIEASQPAQRDPLPPADPIVQLRLTHDDKVCAKTACLRWHMAQPHAKPPPAAALDFARLRLAPGLREAAETGEVDLIVEAIEHRRTVNGRDSVVLVPTNLAAVIPREKSR